MVDVAALPCKTREASTLVTQQGTASATPSAGRFCAHYTNTGRGGIVGGVSDTFRRTRGPATAKFKRAPATGKEAAQRKQFGKEWGAFNSAEAKKLRKGAK